MNASVFVCRYCQATYSVAVKGHGRLREPIFTMAIVPPAHRGSGSYYDGKRFKQCPFCNQSLPVQWWDQEMKVWESCVKGSGLPTIIESKPIGP